LLNRTLSRIGYTCALAADAAEARKYLDEPFGIIKIIGMTIIIIGVFYSQK